MDPFNEKILLKKENQSFVLGNLGLEYSNLGNVRKAIEYYEQALKIARKIGDRCGEGNHLGNMGLAYSHLGEPRKAIEYYEQALKIAREIGDRRGEGNHLGNMGLSYSHLFWTSGETQEHSLKFTKNYCLKITSKMNQFLRTNRFMELFLEIWD